MTLHQTAADLQELVQGWQARICEELSQLSTAGQALDCFGGPHLGARVCCILDNGHSSAWLTQCPRTGYATVGLRTGGAGSWD